MSEVSRFRTDGVFIYTSYSPSLRVPREKIVVDVHCIDNQSACSPFQLSHMSGVPQSDDYHIPAMAKTSCEHHDQLRRIHAQVLDITHSPLIKRQVPDHARSKLLHHLSTRSGTTYFLLRGTKRNRVLPCISKHLRIQINQHSRPEQYGTHINTLTSLPNPLNALPTVAIPPPRASLNVKCHAHKPSSTRAN